MVVKSNIDIREILGEKRIVLVSRIAIEEYLKKIKIATNNFVHKYSRGNICDFNLCGYNSPQLAAKNNFVPGIPRHRTAWFIIYDNSKNEKILYRIRYCAHQYPKITNIVGKLSFSYLVITVFKKDSFQRIYASIHEIVGELASINLLLEIQEVKYLDVFNIGIYLAASSIKIKLLKVEPNKHQNKIEYLKIIQPTKEKRLINDRSNEMGSNYTKSVHGYAFSLSKITMAILLFVTIKSLINFYQNHESKFSKNKCYYCRNKREKLVI